MQIHAGRNSSIPFTAIGVLFGHAFDKAVILIARRWRFLIIGFAVAYASLVLYAPAGILASIGLFLYWIYSALADAIRLDDPNYRMTASKATRLFAVQFVLGLVERVLFLNWIAFAVAVVPGAWLLTKMIAAPILAAASAQDVDQIFVTSTRLTNNNFWQSLTVLIGVRGVFSEHSFSAVSPCRLRSPH